MLSPLLERSSCEYAVQVSVVTPSETEQASQAASVKAPMGEHASHKVLTVARPKSAAVPEKSATPGPSAGLPPKPAKPSVPSVSGTPIPGETCQPSG